MTSMESVEAVVYMRITDSQNHGKVGWEEKFFGVWSFSIF